MAALARVGIASLLILVAAGPGAAAEAPVRPGAGRAATGAVPAGASASASASPPEPATAPPAATTRTDVSLESAIRAFDGGEYERAVELLRALPAGTAAGAEAQFYLGYSLLRLERWTDALVAVEAALALRPDDLRAVYLRALLRLRLGRDGAESDFTRVRDALPDAPIGRSSAEYLTELAAAREAAPAASTNDGEVTAAAERPLEPPASAGPAAAGPHGATQSPWTLRLAGSFTLDLDTNPGLAPEASGTTISSAGSAAKTAPAASVVVRSELTRSLGRGLSVSAAASGFQRLYPPATSGGDSLRGGAGGMRDPGGAGGGRGPIMPGGALESSAGQAGTANDLSDVALELGADWRPGGVALRGGYRGELILYGFAPFAHEHTVWARLTAPSSSWLSGTLRLNALTLQPLDSAYDQLRGYGASARPVASLLLFDGKLLLEVGWGAETYRAADYRDTVTLMVQQASRTFDLAYSYSYDGHGPELYVSWLAPHDVHLVVWGSTVFRTYRGADLWVSREMMMMPAGQGGPEQGGPARRRDTRWLAGARASVGFKEHGELFVEASYLDNRSNLDASGDNRNVRRFLLSCGVAWR